MRDTDPVKDSAEKPRILITGGAGFIGSALARNLLDQGFRVRAMDLREQLIANPPPKEAEVYGGSILDINDISNAVRGCDYVAHIAAMLGVNKTEAHRLECLSINILGTRNVLEACVKERVKKVLFSSSSEVYGDQENALTEETPLQPKSVYAVTKIASEEYLKAYYSYYNLHYTIVRLFNVYGPLQVAEFVMPRFIKAAIEGNPPIVYGDGQQIRCFCYVDDAVRGAALALLSPESNEQVFNIGNNLEPISMRALAEKVIQISEKKLQPVFVPMSNSDRKQGREIYRRIPDISKAKRIFGYEPRVMLKEGITEVFKRNKITETWFDPMSKPPASD